MKVCEVNYSCSVGISAKNANVEREQWPIPSEYSEVRDLIFAKLINTERNKELLYKLPNEPVLDLSLVFYFFRNNDPDDEELLVTDEMLDLWKVDYFQLFEDAMKNTKNVMGETIRPLRELIGDMLKDIEVDLDFKEEDEKMPMYVMTNLWKRNGAVCVLFWDTLRELAAMLEHDLFIIPSSIHEVIIVPATEDVTREALDKMIREVNASELEAEDVLSDHAYFFSRKIGHIEM